MGSEVIYQLYVITPLGFYPALNATPPTKDRKLLERLDDILKDLRPGYGEHYTTFIVSLTEMGLLGEDTLDLLVIKQKSLL